MGQKTNPSDPDCPKAGRETELLHALNAAAALLQRSAHSEVEVFRAFKEQIAELGLNGCIGLLNETGECITLHAFVFPGQMKLVSNFEKITGIRVEDFAFNVAKVDAYMQVIQTGQAIFILDTDTTITQMLPEIARPISGHILETFDKYPCILAPLIFEGNVQGVLYVSGAGLISDDVPTMEAFANHIAIALVNARLFAALQQSEAKLQESHGPGNPCSRAHHCPNHGQ